MERQQGACDSQSAAGPLLSLSSIGKRFGNVQALTDVNLDVQAGEVVGLLGDNGAGKSTLIKIISGVQSATSGSLTIDGRVVRDLDPQKVRSLGIETIYQDLALAPNLDVAQNIFLGREISTNILGILPKIRRREMHEHTQEALQKLRIRIPSLYTQVGNLSGGQRQAVAIARALFWQARLVIMDEPTAALGVSEHEKVIELVHDLAEQGVAVILVTHTMQDALAVTDRIVVLAHGAKALESPTADLDRTQIVHAIMTGEAT